MSNLRIKNKRLKRENKLLQRMAFDNKCTYYDKGRIVQLHREVCFDETEKDQAYIQQQYQRVECELLEDVKTYIHMERKECFDYCCPTTKLSADITIIRWGD